MNETIRVYYNEQCIYFAESATTLILREELANAWVVRNTVDFKSTFLQFATSDFTALIYEGNKEEMFNSFQQVFMEITAGGGIVWNENEELLMIHRLGKWDLPKGKLDPGENLEKCAVREVAEETGLRNIKLINEAKPTYHIYELKENWILKYTAWYQMKAPTQHLVPQAEEDITQAVWVPKREIAEKLENSYPNIIYLLQDII